MVKFDDVSEGTWLKHALPGQQSTLPGGFLDLCGSVLAEGSLYQALRRWGQGTNIKTMIYYDSLY